MIEIPLSVSNDVSGDVKCSPDGLHPVTRAEAMVLMLHHLELAAVYFEAAPSDLDALESAIDRKFDGCIAHRPAWGFVRALHMRYDELNDEYGGDGDN